MPYYRQENRRELFPMSRQRFGPPQMARQQFGSPRPNALTRLRDSFNSSYPIDPRQWQQQFSPYQQGPDPRQWEQQFNPYQQGPDPRQWEQQFNPYQQAPNSGYGGLTNNLSTMMGHVGTVTNGINMMRQVGSIISLFR